MTDNILTLVCLVDEEATSNAFSVEIDPSKTVDGLKKLIKSEKTNDFNDIDADKLTLWRVSIPIIDDDKIPILLNKVTSDKKTKLDLAKRLSKVFLEELPEETVHIIVQWLPPDNKRRTSGGELQAYCFNLVWPRIDAPVHRAESLFVEVHRGICAGNSFVIHGPFQSGKTSFLMALQAELEKKPDEAAVNLSWEDLMAKLQERPRSPRHYVLMDELQSVFRSSILLKAAKKFFRNLSSKTAVSYVAMGTYKITELLLDDGTMEAPFNKAIFARMPPFDLREMGRLFDLYKENCNPNGISRQIQDRIVHESGGHPASFMALLKLILKCRPDEGNWTSLLQENLGVLLN
ncbi:hypothetical protein BGZ74_007516 [Mortierella antarctica]|nr:hypothetical protein BGZ74_007516 [Mortierella antarctica]